MIVLASNTHTCQMTELQSKGVIARECPRVSHAHDTTTQPHHASIIQSPPCLIWQHEKANAFLNIHSGIFSHTADSAVRDCGRSKIALIQFSFFDVQSSTQREISELKMELNWAELNWKRIGLNTWLRGSVSCPNIKQLDWFRPKHDWNVRQTSLIWTRGYPHWKIPLRTRTSPSHFPDSLKPCSTNE